MILDFGKGRLMEINRDSWRLFLIFGDLQRMKYINSSIVAL